MLEEGRKIEAVSIPPNLRPLYEARTATGVIKKATNLLESSDPEEQEALIREPAFSQIIQSALLGLDQRRERGVNQLFSSVEQKNVRALEESLGIKFTP